MLFVVNILGGCLFDIKVSIALSGNIDLLTYRIRIMVLYLRAIICKHNHINHRPTYPLR